MYCPNNDPKYYKALSRKVYQILDQITASEEIRQLWMKIGNSKETQSDFVDLFLGIIPETKFYLMGSAYEGSRTPGMESDLDFLICDIRLMVFQDLTQVEKHTDCLLLVHDDQTKPGYVKLQLVRQGERVFGHIPADCKSCVLDSCNRVIQIKGHLPYVPADELHGPAETIIARPREFAADFVQAFRCNEWPKSASGWFTRRRQYNWPPENLIEEMKSLGFFVVPVGHPKSHEKDKEWRISLSLQERKLMQSLNTTQFKCYVLMKLIKKDIVGHMLTEPSITSYHLKTCLFYTIEETSSHFWKPTNLLRCLRKCLSKMYEWCRSKCCPNYFIPAENMFEGRVEDGLKDRLLHALETLLRSNFHYLLHIKSDSFGELFEASCLGTQIIPTLRKVYIGKQKILIFHGELNTLLEKRLLLFLLVQVSDAKQSFKAFVNVSQVLENVQRINEHTEQETFRVKSLLLPYVEQCIISNALAYQMKSEDQKDNMLNYLISDVWNGLCSSSDCLSAKLKQSTYLHTLGFYQKSLTILETVAENTFPFFMSFCKCRMGCFYNDVFYGDRLGFTVQDDNVSDDDFRKRYWGPCVIFLPVEQTLIPKVLHYEMFRSVCMVDNGRGGMKQFWYDWTAIDSRTLLLFLRYLNFHRLGLTLKSVSELAKLADKLCTDLNLGHIETGLNLLGWALNNENEPYWSIEILQMSLILKRQHNAAVWFLGMILNEYECDVTRIEKKRIEQNVSGEIRILHKELNRLQFYFKKNLAYYSPQYILNEDCPLYRENPDRPIP